MSGGACRFTQMLHKYEALKWHASTIPHNLLLDVEKIKPLKNQITLHVFQTE